ncbi:MAG: hypothetical protein KC583_03615, partial [Myxococcales bacterium]|nr:hypothetical protein [Myxococcales bacterium]
MKSLLMIALLLVFGLALAGCDASTEGAERDRGPVFDDGGVADAAMPPGHADGLDSTVESGQPGGDAAVPDVQPQPPDAGVPARGCSHIDVSGEWVVRSPDARYAFLLRLAQQSGTHAEGAVVPAPQVRCDCGATQMRLVADGDACRLSGRAFEFAGFQEYPGTPDPPTCQDAGFSPSDLAVSLGLVQGAGTVCRASFEIGVPTCDAWPRVPRCTGEGEFEYVDPVVAHRLGDSLDGCTPVGTWYVQRSGGAANGPPTFIAIEQQGPASFTARRWPDQAEGCACGDIEWDAEA